MGIMIQLYYPKMKKKVLIISSSARKGGNSDTLCDAYAEGARSAGHDVEKVRLAKLHIEPCLGCYACEKSGLCAQKDDMAGLLPKLKETDVIVLASPVYFYTICGRLKNFIDRTLPLYPYEGFAGKKWQLIISAAEDEKANMQHAVGDFMGFMECMEEPVIAEPIYGIGAWQMGDIKHKPEILEQARRAGENA